MKKKKFKNFFIYSSLQFAGHVEEYFIQNSTKLIVFVVMPRLNNQHNLLRIYIDGKILKEQRITSSTNIFLYYFLWWYHQNYFILKYFSFNEKFTLLGCHPLCFFGMSVLKLLRRCELAYWIGDYFPGNGIVIKTFEKLKKHYHDRIKYTFYLSDEINKVFNNGKVANSSNRKTVMWGVKPKNISKSRLSKKFHLLFIGLIKDSQGLDFLFSFLRKNTDFKLSIVGVCETRLFKKYKTVIREYNIQKQIFFPNKFFSDKTLDNLSKGCHVGIALYNTDKSNPTYYTDPGKVKAYAEMGLPIVMSNTSGVTPYIRKFHCGEIINRNEKDLKRALVKVKKNIKKYNKGLDAFNNYFYYKNYYKEKLHCLIN